MHVPLAAVLGTCYAGSEAILTATRRAGPRTVRADRGSLALLWLVIGVSVGLAISMCNPVSFLVLLVPTILVFLRRMGVEEHALLAAFGERYRSYMRSTARLLPGIYRSAQSPEE